MGSASYTGVELRKLPPRFQRKIAQLLEPEEGWKKLMCAVPSEANPSKPKFSMEHMQLIERHGYKISRLCGEIFLEEWGTSGRRRPTVETLLDLLVQCRLFRAADYVASEILDVEVPERPSTGPAARVQSTSQVFRRLDIASTSEGFRRLDIVEQNNTPATAVVADPYQEMFEKLNNRDYEKGNLVNFNIALIESATMNFNQEFCIGSGAFGTVYKLDLSRNGGPVLAIKSLTPSSSVVEEQFLTEIRVLSRFRHENLVPLIGYCTNGPQYCLVYEYLERGSLLDAIACKNGTAPIVWNQRLLVLQGVAAGLNFLHTKGEKPLIHRDIKSANVLLNNNLAPKIGDFGLAKSLSSSNQTSAITSTIFGTSAYMAPEAFRGDISPKMDIFSLGVIILELLTGLPPFDESRDGNDIVTFVEDAVDDGDIGGLLDTQAGLIDAIEAKLLYELAQECLEDKKRRPSSEIVVTKVTAIINLSGRARK